MKGRPLRFVRGHSGRIGMRVAEPCACGCGEMASPKHRFVYGHHRRRPSEITEADYDVRDMGHETPCWIWRHATNNKGYGILNRSAAPSKKAYRVSYVQHRGEIPAGLGIDHLCAQPACVNPWHMEPVTNAENTRRARARQAH